jgi:ribosomal protein S18 acetylase RimI-like enzyme
MVSEDEYKAFESPLPFRQDAELDAWRNRLMTLTSSEVSIREAAAVPQDGRRMWDLQLMCSPITPQSIRENVSVITSRLVLVAEIDEVHVGFSMSVLGPKHSDLMFVQLVAVVPEAQQRGAGLALLTAAAERTPQRHIVLATQDQNVAARALNERFADSIGASIRRVPLGTYRDRDLAIRRGMGYRIWVIERPSRASSGRNLT